MVIGIDVFSEHFKDHIDKFIIIGGTACDILMDEMGLDFRTTKDIDIVLLIEALDFEFGKVFWEFIKLGGYENIRRSTGEKEFYRFEKPKNKNFPYMLELFAKKPNILEIPEDTTLVSITLSEEISGLSAILLNEDYYNFILDGRKEIDNLPVIDIEYIIPMKVRAFLDLSARKEKGEDIRSNDIRKHKNDVFRLLNILSPDTKLSIAQTISDDMNAFIDKIEKDPPILKDLKIKGKSVEEVLQDLSNIYQLNKLK